MSRSVSVSLIAGALLLQVPYVALIATFDYPDVLRQDPGVILAQFQAGGPTLIGMWLGFAWAGAPLLYGLSALPPVLWDRPSPWVTAATWLGMASLVVQIVGLLRWVFVVPVLAGLYTDPASSEMTREVARVGFQVVHAYGGVALGEHLGQLWTIAWMVGVSAALWSGSAVRRALAGFGFVGAAVYALAQGELFATVIPNFPQWGPAGLVGSLAWLAFLVALGVMVWVEPSGRTRSA
jgi:hypothetical protein